MTARTMSAAKFSIKVEASVAPTIIPITAAKSTARTERTMKEQQPFTLLNWWHIIFIILFVSRLEVIPLQYIMKENKKVLPKKKTAAKNCGGFQCGFGLFVRPNK